MNPSTILDLEEVQRQLAQTCNDPDMIICCWSFSFCKKCSLFAGECKCKDQPWNLPYDEQQKWLKEEQERLLNLSKSKDILAG